MRKIWWGGLAHAWVPFVPSHWHHLLHCQNIPLQMWKYPISNVNIFHYKYENDWVENIAFSIKKFNLAFLCWKRCIFIRNCIFVTNLHFPHIQTVDPGQSSEENMSHKLRDMFYNSAIQYCM